MTLYQSRILADVREDGVYVHHSVANAVDINGTLYAEVGSSLLNAEGWHETAAAAREEAAQKVLLMAAALTAQAVRIRAGGR